MQIISCGDRTLVRKNDTKNKYYHASIAVKGKSQSSDYFICKKYNVTMDQYIDNVQRANGKKIETGEYLVDDNSLKPGNGRAGKADYRKSNNPIYIENGDIVTYKVVLNNNANEDGPYYSPHEVVVRLSDALPTDTAKFVDASYNLTGGVNERSNVQLKYKASKQFLYDPQAKNFNLKSIRDNGNMSAGQWNTVTLQNSQTCTITIRIQINADANTTYDYDKLLKNIVKIDRIKNYNGKSTKAKTKDESNQSSEEDTDEQSWTELDNDDTDLDDTSDKQGDASNEEGTDDDDLGVAYMGSDGAIINNVSNDKAYAIDYVRIKDYNIALDKYISKVEHVVNQTDANCNFGPTTTYNSTGRRVALSSAGTEDNAKNNNPVYVEYGDRVTYTLVLYNTTDDEYYNVGKENAPYKYPQYLNVTVTDTLPDNVSSVTVDGVAQNPSGNKLTINKKVKAGSTATVTVTLVVEDVNKDIYRTNSAQITAWTNINGYNVVNKGTDAARTSSDTYHLSEYKATLEEHIRDYDGAMAKYNDKYGFTENDDNSFSGGTTSYSYDTPLDVEKYETLTYETTVTNTYNSDELENTTGSYGKYRTRVRPTEMTITLDSGLSYDSYEILWHHTDGREENITSKFSISTNTLDTKIAYTYRLTDDSIILAPGEYLIYRTTVKVTESNMYLGRLQSKSEITKLTNVNDVINGLNNSRIVTGQNTDSPTTDSDYVRLKDLVIAGTVWEDSNRDGYNNGEESGKENIVVKLYRVGNEDKPVITETDENGFYSFGRQPKTSKDKNKNYSSTTYYQYYVEFEYDGETYKSTEVYGGSAGSTEKTNYGQGNLEADGTWRQGYADLPGTTNGRSEYMIDSNAYEFDDVRNKFDSMFKTIGFNKAYDSRIDLSYTKTPHESTLNEDSSRVMKARSFITQDFTTTVNESLDNTNTLFFYTDYSYSNAQPETEYLKFINLGLVEREKVDVSIDADVTSVKTTINGEEMTYEFGTNEANSTDNTYNNDSYENNYELDTPYSLLIDETDYNYRYDSYYDDNNVKSYKGTSNDSTVSSNSDENELNHVGQNELTAEVNYKLNLRSKVINNDEPSWGMSDREQNIPIETEINEIAIYYNDNFVGAEELDDLLAKQTTVKKKNSETGILEDYTTESIRITYEKPNEENETETESIDLRAKISMTSSYGANKNVVKDGYRLIYLTGLETIDGEEVYLKEGDTAEINLTLTVDKSKIGDLDRSLKIDGSKDMGLDIITEISAYTTKYSSSYKHAGLAGHYAGLVDTDSNPGNVGTPNTGSTDQVGLTASDFYEDDTYRAGVEIVTSTTPPDTPPPSEGEKITREITGLVWDDARSDTAIDTSIDTSSESVQYIGNGIYDSTDTNNSNANTNPYNLSVSKDTPVAGVKVSLIELVQTQAVDSDGNAIYYEQPAKYTVDWTENGTTHKAGDPIECVTGENGTYSLSHFVPGYYKVRFDYGYDSTDDNNIIYNGQDYKSTTYYSATGTNNTVDSYETDNIGSTSNFAHFNEIKSSLAKENRSDAQDDEIRRLNVNSYSETMTTKQAVVFSETSNNKSKLTKNTHMYAESTIFYVKPENVDAEIVSIDATTDTFKKITSRRWSLSNLDFGLEYRPEASVVLEKDIKTLELVTSDNETLVKLYFKDDNTIDEDKSIGYENVQFTPNTESNNGENQGFVYINMDSDILEGCTVKVEYEMDSTNESEVDRINQNLDAIKYEYGANAYGSYKVYVTHNADSADNVQYTYNANATAAQFLASKYYEGYEYLISDTTYGTKETYNYIKKLKKAYSTSGSINVSDDTELKGTGYYGIYLGQTYYTGKVGDYDVVAELKVDSILDYIDNDFTFDTTENSSKDRLWQATTSEELKDVLDWRKVNTICYDEDGNVVSANSSDVKYKYLIDKNGIRYDTDTTTNLALSVDDNKQGNLSSGRTTGNASLSRFLQTAKKEAGRTDETTGTISAIATKTLSADDVTQGKGLSYENVSEIVQYTSLTGRRTTLPDGNGNGGIIANANVVNWSSPEFLSKANAETDTDATEVITIAPPTGLTE